MQLGVLKSSLLVQHRRFAPRRLVHLHPAHAAFSARRFAVELAPTPPSPSLPEEHGLGGGVELRELRHELLLARVVSVVVQPVLGGAGEADELLPLLGGRDRVELRRAK